MIVVTTFKYSFVIPCHNEQDWIVRLLNALVHLNFDKDEFEVVVVDNNCQDETVERVWNFSKDFRINLRLVHEYRKGVSVARNSGAKVVSGKYLIFLDADNVVGPDFLLDIDREVYRKAAVGFSIRTLPDCYTFRGLIVFWTLEIIKMYSGRPFGKSVVLREVFDSINGFDTNIVLGENVDFMVRVRLRARELQQAFGHIKSPIYCSLRRFEKVGYIRTLIPWGIAYCGTMSLPYKAMSDLP